MGEQNKLGQSVPEVEDFHCRRLTARFDENVKLKAKTKKGKKNGCHKSGKEEQEEAEERSSEVSLSVARSPKLAASSRRSRTRKSSERNKQ